MKRIFGTKAPQAPAPTLQETTARISTRAEGPASSSSVARRYDEKIAKLDGQLAKIREQLKAARTPQAETQIKNRAMSIIKQKRMYENQRNQMFNQQMNLESVAFTTEQLKDTAEAVKSMQVAAKEIRGQLKLHKIDDIEKLTDELADLHDMNEEIQEIMGRSFAMPDDIDDEELMGELDALEADLAFEVEQPSASGVPSYLDEVSLPDAPTQQAAKQEVTPALHV